MERAVRKLKSGKASGVCGIRIYTGGDGARQGDTQWCMQWLRDIIDIARLEMWKVTSQMEGGYHCTYLQEGQ